MCNHFLLYKVAIKNQNLTNIQGKGLEFITVLFSEPTLRANMHISGDFICMIFQTKTEIPVLTKKSPSSAKGVEQGLNWYFPAISFFQF